MANYDPWLEEGFAGDYSYNRDGMASMPEVLLGDNRWTTESPIQQPSNPGAGGPYWAGPALAAYFTGSYLGDKVGISGPMEAGVEYIENALTPNVNSVAMEGPMRFAGRGIPKNEGHYIDAPDGPYFPGLPGPDYPEMIPMPMPKFPIHPGPEGPNIIPPLATEPYIPPAHIGRHPPDSTMIVPEVVYPPEDTRSEWEKWRDSFRDDWRAK